MEKKREIPFNDAISLAELRQMEIEDNVKQMGEFPEYDFKGYEDEIDSYEEGMLEDAIDNDNSDLPEEFYDAYDFASTRK